MCFWLPILDIQKFRWRRSGRMGDLPCWQNRMRQELFLAMAQDGRQIFVMGHPEYDRVTLDGEYKRDLNKGLPIEMPKNYYKDDNPDNKPLLTWRATANNLYTNWLNYYVYQVTPYDLLGTPSF